MGLVRFLATADTSSNKPEKFAVQAPAQAYWYERPTGYRVAVLKPKLDRLSVTFSVHDDAIKAAIRVHLSKLAAGAGSIVTPWQKRRDWGSQKYDRAYALKVAPGRTVLVQCAPLTSANSLLRFEFNPNGIGPEAVKAFRESIPLLTAGHFDYQALATQGRVTRLDIAVDLVNIDIEDVLIATPKPGVTNSYFGLSGKAETKYLNVNKKGSRMYVYDRRALLAKLNAEGTRRAIRIRQREIYAGRGPYRGGDFDHSHGRHEQQAVADRSVRHRGGRPTRTVASLEAVSGTPAGIAVWPARLPFYRRGSVRRTS